MRLQASGRTSVASSAVSVLSRWVFQVSPAPVCTGYGPERVLCLFDMVGMPPCGQACASRGLGAGLDAGRSGAGALRLLPA